MAEAPNFRGFEYVTEGLEIFKANLVPMIICTLLCGIPIVGIIFMVNFLESIKAYKAEQKPINFSDVINFDNAVDKLVAGIVVGIGFSIFFIPGTLFFWALYIMADKPGTPFAEALTTALNFAKDNLVPNLIAIILCMIPGIIPIVGPPIALSAAWIAFDENRDAITGGGGGDAPAA